MRNGVAGVLIVVVLGLSSCAGGSSSGTSTTQPSPSTTAAPTTSTSLVVITSPTWFSTPSMNISCAVSADSARCDIVERTWTPPAKPADCPLDWGSSLVVGAGKVARFACNSDTVYRPEVQVPFGRRVVDGSMSCDVVTEGVTCRAADGHGFFLSKESYRLF